MSSTHKRMNDMNFSKFTLLASELQQHIIQQCDSGDILRLAQSSHGMYTLALPLMYRHVDLSYHNETGLFPSVHRDKMVEGNNPDREISAAKLDHLKTRQESFIDRIIKTKSRGALVISLTWTYQWFYEDWHVTDEGQQKMWKAFKLLTRIQTLDICSFNNEHFPVVPTTLFPTARKIRIGGKMPYAFFRGMVSKPENVVSLDLDNLQGFEQERDGPSDDPEVTDPDYIVLHQLDQETEDEKGLPLLRHAGAMRGHLTPLFGQFTNLKYLYIRTVGQDDCTDTKWSKAREEARYTEIARFTVSVSSTLTTLVFEQGVEPEENAIYSCRGDPRRIHQVGRPMDTYFLSFLFPTLVEASWPKLKYLSLRGIGGKTRECKPGVMGIRSSVPEDPAILEAAEDQLRVALGNGIEIRWEKEVGRSFYLLGGSNYGDPIAD